MRRRGRRSPRTTEKITGAGKVTTRFPHSGGGGNSGTARLVPRPGGCLDTDGADVDPGVTNQWNWVSALRAFRNDATSTPDLDLLMGMLGQAMWVASGANSDFWDNFVAQLGAGDYLSSSQRDDWADAAESWCIDH